jgi:hypothetical protein
MIVQCVKVVNRRHVDRAEMSGAFEEERGLIAGKK